MRCEMLRPLLLSTAPAGGIDRLRSGPDSARGPTGSDEEIRSLGRRVEGSGWASSGAGQRHEISMDEKVQRKVGGTVLLVEGRGTRKTDRGEVVVTHEALALCTTTTRRAVSLEFP